MFRLSVKRLVCAVMMLGACVAAEATTTNLGAVSVGPPTPFSGTVLGAGPFGDIFTFTLPANGGSGYSVVNFPLTIPGLGSFNTVFGSFALFSNPDGILFNGDDSLLNSIAGPGGSLSLSWGPTAGGPMYLFVTGIASGSIGGLYSGAISVSAVPEAGTWAMMLAGLGLLGFIVNRRKQ